MGLPQYNADQINDTKSVYFVNDTGADYTFLGGEAVCYDLDDTNTPVTNTTDPKNSRGRKVGKPVTARLGAFAGITAAATAGKIVKSTFGAFIDIIVPRKGDTLKVQTKANQTKGSTVVGITNAGGFQLVAMTDATFNLDVVGVSFETVDTSTTAAPQLVKFM